MSFQPTVNQVITIDDKTFLIAEHPNAPGIPHGQEGRQAIVYRLIAGEGEQRALKVFKPRFRVPSMVALADKLAAYATLSSLRVCARMVLSARRHGELLRANPDLTYAVLMPWIDGPTWTEIIHDKRAMTREQSLHLAYVLAENLAAMEERGVAHCDLSAPNVLVPLLAPDPGSFAPVELVDVEQLYAPDLVRPEAIPSGSLGYAHQTAREGLWHTKADRFAGAILIAEMLGWCDARVQIAAWGESYFDPNELQQDTGQYQNLMRALRDEWGDAVAKLLERAWRSDTLDDCPTFGEWLITLPVNQPRVAINVQVPARPTTSPRVQDPLIAQAIELEKQGDIVGALNVYQNMLARLAQNDPLRAELAHIIARLETASNNAQQIRDWIVQANVDAQGGNWKRAAMGYRYALGQSPASPYAEEWRAAMARCEDEAELAEMFDAGVAARTRGEIGSAYELFDGIVRRRASYQRNGTSAVAILEIVRQQIKPRRWYEDRRIRMAVAVVTVGMIGLFCLVLGGTGFVILSNSITPTPILSALSIPSPTPFQISETPTRFFVQSTATPTWIVESTSTPTRRPLVMTGPLSTRPPIATITRVPTRPPLFLSPPSDGLLPCNSDRSGQSGNVGIAYIDITKVRIFCEGEKLTAEIYLRGIPQQLEFTRKGVPNNKIEYNWMVAIDVDNSSGTGGGLWDVYRANNYKGFDYKIGAFPLVTGLPYNLPEMKSVSVLTAIVQVFKIDSSGAGMSSPMGSMAEFLSVDSAKGLITISGNIPGLSRQSRFYVGAYDYNPGGSETADHIPE